MAIRKDIDDILNNLKDGKPLESPQKNESTEAAEAPTAQPEMMDSDALDALLTSLIGIADSETAAEEAAVVPEAAPKKKKIVINNELPDYEAIREASLNGNKKQAAKDVNYAENTQDMALSGNTAPIFARGEAVANAAEQAAEEIASPDYLYEADENSAEQAEEITQSKNEFTFFKNAPVRNEARSAENSEEKKSAKGSITSVLHNILDEDPDDIMNQQRYFAEYSTEPRKGRFKKAFYAIFGVIFAILACVGLVTVIIKSMGLINSYTSGETKKESFEEILYPAVIMDIESFNSPDQLPPDQIITAAIWSMIMADDVTMQYERAFDVVIIPATDVEAYAVKLFGDKIPELTHATVGPAESRFYYNEETKSYNVPIAPVTYTYSPEIKEAVKTGNEYTVKVDYIDELPSWLPKTSSKSVKFKLVENNGSFILQSMTIISTNTNAV